MDLREVLDAIRAGWWLPTLGLLVGGSVAVLAAVLQTPMYTSTTQLFVSTTTESASTSDAFQGSQFSQQRVASYARLLEGEQLAGRVIGRLDLDVPPHRLTERISATAVLDTVLIDVAVVDTSPEQAQRIARVLGEEFTRFVEELETPADGGASLVRVTVTDDPEVPDRPTSPNIARNTAFGLLAGLLLGAALGVLRARLDRSVKDPDQAAQLVGAPVIGTVLRDDDLGKVHTTDRGGNPSTAEAYRQLRTNLQFLNVDEPPKVIMVSSALPSEGKTTVVINLALALVEAGRRVTVVEADLRRPKVTRYLGLVGGVGLTNVLSNSATLEEVTQTYREGLDVITAGPLPPNPGELLGSTHMVSLVEQLRGTADFVLVDAAPLLPVADSAALAAAVDGVLISVRYGSTGKDQLRQAAHALGRVGANVLGVVLNVVPPKADVAQARGYGYSYESDFDGSAASRAAS